MCATCCIVVYIVFFALFLFLLLFLSLGVQSSLQSRCIVVFAFLCRCSCSCCCYCCRWCAVNVFFLCRSAFVAIRLPRPPLLVAITVYCCFYCFVLFRVVSRCFVLLLSLSMWLLLCSYLLSLSCGEIEFGELVW